MNIIQVGPYPLAADCIKGGVESSVFGLSNKLSINNVVDVFDLPRIGGKDTGCRQGNLCIHRYANPGKHNIDAIQRVNEILRDIIALHPDVVHVHGTGEISSIIYQALKEYGFKVLLTVHGLLHIEKANQLRKKISIKHIYQYIHQSKVEFDTLSHTERIIVDTEYVAKQIESLYAKRKIKSLPEMHVIPQGINEVYLSLNRIPADNLILSVGAISERKGHMCLLQAFEQLCSTNPSAQLVIAGSLADKKYHQRLVQYILQSPYKEHISVYTNLPQQDIFALYQQAKIFALHSQEESQGIVFAEAMAVGLPVVATHVGGVPYVVENAKSGLLCQYGDILAMAEMMAKLLDNQQVYNAFSAHAKQLAHAYSWKNIAEQVESLYQQL